jgi:hypothetical protein
VPAPQDPLDHKVLKVLPDLKGKQVQQDPLVRLDLLDLPAQLPRSKPPIYPAPNATMTPP